MKLSTKCVLIYVICLALPLFALTWLAFQASSETISSVLHDSLSAQVSQSLAELNEHVDVSIKNLEDWSQLQVMQDLVRNDPNDILTLELQRLVRRYLAFRELLVVDNNGQIVAASTDNPTPINWPTNEAFATTMAGNLYESPVSKNSGADPAITVASPIRANNDPSKIVGALVGIVDWRALKKELSLRPVLGQQQSANYRYLLLAGTPPVVLYDNFGASPLLDSAEVSALQTQSGIHRTTLHDIDYVVATAQNENHRASTWRLFALVASDEAYSAVDELGHRFVSISFGGLLVASIFLLLALRAFIKPISSLANASDLLANNDFTFALPKPSNDELGRLTQSFGRMRDAVETHRSSLELEVNERKQAEELAWQAQQKTLEASKAKSQFLAAMSHEIRTPINGVLGMTDLMLRTELNTEQRRFAENIDRSGEALLAVINDILDFSEIESGTMALDDAPFNLLELLEDVTELASEAAARKGLELTCFVPKEVPIELWGDSVRLGQVVSNLLSNAIKFTEHGQITLQTQCECINNGHATLRISVSDSGIGIAEEAQQHIFESFRQEDGSSTRRFGGTGLGLSITKNLVELMGGSISVDSERQRGSTFTVVVTFARSKNRGQPPQKLDALHGTRILVVDDNATNREILEHQLSDFGAHVTCCDNAEAALMYLETKSPYDFAILDQSMPDIDGLELAEIIRNNSDYDDLTLVILSSIANHTNGDVWRNAGIAAFVTKPVRQTRLYRCLAGLREPPNESTYTSENTTSEIEHFSASILLAEDHPVNQEVQKAMLGLLGCRVTVVETGLEALTALRQNKFDLVLMDCNMPELDGFEVTTQFRKFEQSSGQIKTPVIALTANALDGDRDICLNAGMDDYLTKPINTQRLADAFTKWIPQLRAHEPLSNVTSIIPCQDGLSAQSDDLSPLDADVISAIRDLDNDDSAQFLQALRDKYEENWTRDMRSLVTAFSAADQNTVKSLAHRLKSSSANLGAVGLAALCEEVEHRARSNEINPIDDSLLKRMQDEHQRVSNALITECRRVA